MDRFEVLNDLIAFRRSTADLSKDLSGFDWDCEGDPAIVSAADVVAVLKGFVSNHFSAKDLENWANLIECREDLDYEEANREAIEEVIDALANPVLQGEITVQSCEAFLNRLRS